MVSAAVVVTISTILTYVTERSRFSLDETREISAGSLAWYLYGVMVSQGELLCRNRKELEYIVIRI